MTELFWFVFVLSLGSAGYNLYGVHRNRKLRRIMELVCDHDWKPVKVQYNELQQTFVLLRCTKCTGTCVAVHPGRWTLDDLEPAPTAEQLNRAFPDAHL